MSVKKDASGRRSVQVEVEVPGTPEEVWQAIATGPGISSWFVPTEVEERVGRAVTFHLGPGMDSLGTVTAWEPPFRLAYEERDWSPNAPPLATECIVEARSGGACIVRMVHSLFTSSEDWDDQLGSFESGWPSFFHILQLYLTHFRGERGSAFRVTGSATGSESEAWEALTGALGLAGATKGQQRNAPASGVPPLAGIIERKGEGKHVHELTLRLDEPTPGVAWLGVYTWGGKVQATISFYLFGDRAPVISARDEPLWHAWMNEHSRVDRLDSFTIARWSIGRFHVRDQLRALFVATFRQVHIIADSGGAALARVVRVGLEFATSITSAGEPLHALLRGHFMR